MGRKPGSILFVGLVATAAMVGLALIADSAGRTSATYDETTYLRVAARWWRTGEQSEITRMGSPLTFWKLQQTPVFWVLDRTGRGGLIDEPIRRQSELLPIVRIGGSWIWLAGLLLTAGWSRAAYGDRAMALAAWLFALSPNLLAHGGLATMETPILACTAAVLFLFWRFRATGRTRWLWASAAAAGLAFSCKSTAVLLPPLIAAAWWIDDLARAGRAGLIARTLRLAAAMAGFVALMLAADVAVTGFALMPLSGSTGDHPSIAARFGRLGPLARAIYETRWPQDWVGFATQVHHQMSGGPSYLLGERRMTGWRSYYLIAMAVKVPLTFWLLVIGSAVLGRDPRRVAAAEGRDPHDELLPLLVVLFVLAASLGSTRNYGIRYMLPMAPVAIVWVSRLAEGNGRRAGWAAGVVGLGLAGQAAAVATWHPFELTYFNAIAGGPIGGRRILADSNLDWGQGLRGLARLQRERPEMRDVTLYYFGDTDPSYYGVQGLAHVVNAVDDHSALPPLGEVRTRFVAVSASLQHGPWGPEGFFRALDGIAPICLTDDTTIAVYRNPGAGAIVP
ncbi:ArnT family glycosyltransferase [Aquisphaera insulae]|uniref:ArnT family glycosyltransferase n=1 Tax=Aquisphaera insulae TaxID=2712864 RepID=UPI0013EA3766|nr:glycosyltransferase family 39 protein [Aquisphaera insulae]